MRFEQPASLGEALAALEREPGAVILAGGTDLLVRFQKERRFPDALLDITRIPELQTIQAEDGWVRVGAAVTCAQIERSAQLRFACPLLQAAAGEIGSPQIRSKATVGGNIAHASPAADFMPVLTALDAQAEIAGPQGRRTAGIPELVTGASQSALRPGELLVAFRFAQAEAATCWSFAKLGRRAALAISRLNGACVFRGREGRMEDVRLCVGAATAAPRRFREAERLLEGERPARELFAAAGEAVAREILCETGRRESSGYKLPVAAELTVRLLERAWRREHEA